MKNTYALKYSNVLTFRCNMILVKLSKELFPSDKSTSIYYIINIANVFARVQNRIRVDTTCMIVVESLSHVRLFVTPWTTSMTGFPVLYHPLELAQTHVHWVGDTIQPTTSPSLLSPSPPFNLSQHQGLFQWVSSLYQLAKVLVLQPQPLQWTLRIDFLKDFMVLSPCSPRDSQES